METFYLLIVLLLLGLAVFDLVVGVSNDAVNFLTSAVGSKAASFQAIILVASVGVLIGAASSGGMMEVAKSGVFLPDKLTFQQVICIYLCVMMADILLLDFFNSLKLPTSTTISIVFELLGASVAVSLFSMARNQVPLTDFGEYINTSKAIQMIVAIFVSVAIAFVVGWLVQFLLRAATTFDYRQNSGIGGAVFGAVSVVVVLNFVINVGLKNSPAHNSYLVEFVTKHFLVLAAWTGLGVAGVFLVLVKKTAFDPFRFVTLLGTFALAMAFASNDLVNFIGVPVASFEAYSLWRQSHVAADEFTLEAFLHPGPAASSWMLIVAGIIMVLTLYSSKKARNVIQTTVNLSRQKDGLERFSGNAASRGVVLGVSHVAGSIVRSLPPGLTAWFSRRYAIQPPLVLDGKEPPAFDLVRASANLIVAAFLISLGTAWKLPLSTTYVSFMVLMGTSLADRAWNRDSAVYRVSGVFTVISGWFLTAVAALTLSSVFAITVTQLGYMGMVLVLTFVVLAMVFINRMTDSSLHIENTIELPEGWFAKPPADLAPFLGQRVRDSADSYAAALARLIEAVEHEDRGAARQIDGEIHQQLAVTRSYTERLNDYIRSVPGENLPSGKLLLEFFYLETLLLNQNVQMVAVGTTHILNLHKPLELEQITRLDQMVQDMASFCQVLPSTVGREEPQAELTRLRGELDGSIVLQVEGLIEDRYNYKNSMLYLNLLLRNLEIAEILMRMDELAENAAHQPANPRAHSGQAPPNQQE